MSEIPTTHHSSVFRGVERECILSLQQKLEAERQRVAEIEAFMRRLLDREDLRWAVSDEVAHVALQLLRKTTGANPAQEERGLVRDALKR